MYGSRSMAAQARWHGLHPVAWAWLSIELENALTFWRIPLELLELLPASIKASPSLFRSLLGVDCTLSLLFP